MKYGYPSENQLQMTFDIRRFETAPFFYKQYIRTLDDILLIKFIFLRFFYDDFANVLIHFSPHIYNVDKKLRSSSIVLEYG